MKYFGEKFATALLATSLSGCVSVTTGTLEIFLNLVAQAPSFDYGADPLMLPENATGYSLPPNASGTAPITYALTSGVLPGTLTLNASTGAIEGTVPAAAAANSVTIEATNSEGTTSLTLDIGVAELVPDLSYPSATYTVYSGLPIGAPINLTNLGSPPTGAYVLNPGMAIGIAFNTGTGQFTGMPSGTIGTYSFTVDATNGAGTDSVNIDFDLQPGPITQSIITIGPTSVDAGACVAINITALDDAGNSSAYGNPTLGIMTTLGSLYTNASCTSSTVTSITLTSETTNTLYVQAENPIGTATVVTTSGVGTHGSDTVTFVPAPIATSTITANSNPMAAGVCDSFNVLGFDIYGNPSINTGTGINVSTNLGNLYDAGCATGISTVDITSLTTNNIYLSSITSGGATVQTTGLSGSNGSATVAIDAGAISESLVSITPTNAETGDCTQVDVFGIDLFGNPSNQGSPAVPLSDSIGGSFYTGASCISGPTGTVSITSTGANTVYYKATSVGANTIATTGLTTNGSDSLTIDPGPVTISVVSPLSGTTAAGACIGVDIVGQDDFGNPSINGAGSVNLSATHGSFYTANDCLSGLIPGGTTPTVSLVSTANNIFYYGTTTATSSTIETTGLTNTNGSSVVGVNPGPEYQLVFDTAFPATVTDGVPFSVQPVVSLQDQWSNPITSSSSNIRIQAYTATDCSGGTTGTMTSGLAPASTGTGTFSAAAYNAGTMGLIGIGFDWTGGALGGGNLCTTTTAASPAPDLVIDDAEQFGANFKQVMIPGAGSSTNSRVVTIRNIGTANSGTLSSGTLVGAFAILTDTCNGVDLTPGATCNIDIQHTVNNTDSTGEVTDSFVVTGLDSVTVNVKAILAAPTAIRRVEVGDRHACAITMNNNLYCWGGNNYGQVGDGTTTQRNTPVLISDGTLLPGSSVYDVRVGANHTCARYMGGTEDLACWGRNDQGQLGVGDTTDRSTPTTAISSFLTGQFTLGYQSTCVRDGTSDPSTWSCWGNGLSLGNGSPSDVIAASSRTSIVNAGSTAISFLNDIGLGYDHGCGVIDDIGVMKPYCWGEDNNQQLGDADSTTSNNILFAAPVQDQDSPGNVDAVAPSRFMIVSGRFSCTFDIVNFDLSCWGANAQRELGVSGTYTHPNEATLTAPSFPSEVDSGRYASCFIFSGEVRCIGYNGSGIYASGSTAPGWGFSSMATMSTGWTSVSVGTYNVCGIRWDSGSQEVRCWGTLDYGTNGIPTPGTGSATAPQAPITFP